MCSYLVEYMPITTRWTNGHTLRFWCEATSTVTVQDKQNIEGKWGYYGTPKPLGSKIALRYNLQAVQNNIWCTNSKPLLQHCTITSVQQLQVYTTLLWVIGLPEGNSEHPNDCKGKSGGLQRVCWQTSSVSTVSLLLGGSCYSSGQATSNHCCSQFMHMGACTYSY